MTKERKTEIMELIDKDMDDVNHITKNEAKEFLDCLSEEEHKIVSDKLAYNRRKRAFEKEENRRRKIMDSCDERIFRTENVVAIAKCQTPIINIQTRYKELADFIVEYMTPKKATCKRIEELDSTFYECPDCSISIVHGQPFCANCGRMIDWSELDANIFAI